MKIDCKKTHQMRISMRKSFYIFPPWNVGYVVEWIHSVFKWYSDVSFSGLTNSSTYCFTNMSRAFLAQSRAKVKRFKKKPKLALTPQNQKEEIFVRKEIDKSKRISDKSQKNLALSYFVLCNNWLKISSNRAWKSF